MLFAVKVFLFLFLSLPAFAESQAIAEHKSEMDKYLQEAKILDQRSRAQVESILKSERTTNQHNNCGCQKSSNLSLAPIANSNASNVLIFISFSMPKISLRNLFIEATQQGATLVLRGLKNNSFKETAERMKELAIAAQIDPELFDKYQINTVPTFVLATEPEPLLLKGNVSLSYARDAFKQALKEGS